jgi:hypothetical protein
MDAKNLIPIVIFSVLCVLGLSLFFYGLTQPAVISLLDRYNHSFMGEINVFTLIGLVMFPVNLLLLIVWVLTLPKKPSDKTKTKPKWWTSYWLAIAIATIVIGITLPILGDIPWERAVLYLAAVLAMEAVAYYARVKPSINLNKVMYTLLGVPIGFVIWFIFIFAIERTSYPQAAGDSVVFIGSMLVCFGIGAIVGNFIGWLRDYKGPEQYQP